MLVAISLGAQAAQELEAHLRDKKNKGQIVKTVAWDYLDKLRYSVHVLL